MIDPHLQVVLTYLAFMGVGTLLALVRRAIRPQSEADSVWKKYPIYILLNIMFLAAAWLPHNWHGLAWLSALIGGAASWEFSRALRLTRLERVGLPIITASLIMAAEWLAIGTLLKIWLAVVLGSSAASALAGSRVDLGRRIAGLAGCLVYLPLCLASLAWVSQLDESGFRAAFVYLVIATNDAFAQFVGQLFGRRPLAPHISPAKTVEGAAGGLVFAALIGASLSATVGWSYLQGTLLGMTIGLAGLTGDLAESGWKRALGLKDFSTLLGAQGGVLDRFDALIFAAPIFFLLVSSASI